MENVYLGIPIASCCCFVFLLLCFMGAGRMRALTYFRLALIASFLWLASDVAYRIQMVPGLRFWFQFSLLGLMLLPICMYAFLFETLKLDKNRFIICCTAATVLGTIANAKWDLISKPVEQVNISSEKIGYVYEMTAGTWVTMAIELAVMFYVTYVAYRVIGKERSYYWKLGPLLLGTISVWAGQLLEMVVNNYFPFGAFGGLIMAICIVYVMTKQYLFDLSRQMVIGSVYTITLILAFSPVFIVSGHIEQLAAIFRSTQGMLFASTAVMLLWVFILFNVAHGLINDIVLKEQRQQYDELHRFQWETTSFLDEEALFKQTADAVNRVISNGRVLIFTRKNEGEEYDLVRVRDEDYGIDYEEKSKILQKFHTMSAEPNVEIAPLQYDKTTWGFLYIMFQGKVRMNYTEVEYFSQIAAYTSICMKNIRIYQEAYQNSIHDDLTGLYNRRYYREFIEKYWMAHEPQALMHLDIDDFKLFNELYGEGFADEILKWCAKQIRETVDAKGAVFRTGSNEFVVYSRYRGEEEMVSLAQAILARIEGSDRDKPDILQPITMSIGIALYPDTAQDAAGLLKQAEKAGNFAKSEVASRVRVYRSEEMPRDLEESTKHYEKLAPTIYALVAAIDAKDSYTFEHSVHVSQYAVKLAMAAGLDESEVQTVREAGMLHDIGKIGIPDSILKKKGKLTAEEYETMKTHVVNSIKMIHYLPNMNYVIPAVVSHHERYDGKGYPRGIEGEQIPILGRVLAVCDSYDAMTSKRVYKDSMPTEAAIEELEKNMGAQFDPKLTEIFIRLIRDGEI